jgi:hypothetical protein
MPLKPGDPGFDYQSGGPQQTSRTSPSGNRVVEAPSNQPPSGGSVTQSSNMTLLGNSGYYHPSNGIGTMTGVWGDARPNGRRHKGQDIRMPMGTPMIAVTSGRIQHYSNSSAGTVVYLHGDDGNRYSYFHLSSRTTRAGARVTGGQVIALSGNTGNSSGPHLHFEVRQGGTKVDPRPFLAGTMAGMVGTPPPSGGFNEDQKQPTDTSLADRELYWQGENRITPSFAQGEEEQQEIPPWIAQLEQYRNELRTQRGQDPIKSKASAMLRRSLGSMSSMTRKYGFQAGASTTAARMAESENKVQQISRETQERP